MLIRSNIPAAFDRDVTRQIYQMFRGEVGLYLDHVKVETPDKSDMVKVAAYSGLATMGQKPEGADIPVSEPVQRFTQVFTHLTYAQGFEASYEMIEDDRRRDVAKFAQSLGRSARDAINILAANVLNNGYSSTWGDGTYLFSTAHTTAGANVANTPSSAADLSATTLAAGLVSLWNQVDHNGLKIPVTGVGLHVSPTLDQTAIELTQSAQVPYATDNEINYIRGRVSYGRPNPYLTDTDQWSLVATGGRHGLLFFLREAFNSAAYMKDSNLGLVHYAKFRASAGVEEWRGTYGSSGAA